MRTLVKEKPFSYDSKELLGVMRFDFYDGRLANQWNPRELIIELNKRNEIGYDNETLIYIELKEGKYVIKLIPVLDNYSYIYAYKR